MEMNMSKSCYTVLMIVLLMLAGTMAQAAEQPSKLPAGKWKLMFKDEFSGADKEQDKAWEFQNGPSGHILCSRWRENAVVTNGILRLLAKKEERGGQKWTAASMWTKNKFLYGYFECRYKYAKAKGTNNSFWLMTRDRAEAKATGDKNVDAIEGQFEVDINEGHYPDKINMNIHNWSGKHWAKSKEKKAEGMNLADTYHTYGLEWNKEELIWFFDGKEIRREKNTICHKPTPVWLSLAIIKWAGPVTDAIDGTSMDVDYVRVYQKETAGQ